MQIKKQIFMVAALMLAGSANVFACQVWENLGCAIASELQVSGAARFCGPVQFKSTVEFCKPIIGPGELVFTSSDIMFAKCRVLDGSTLDFPPFLSPAQQTVFDFVYPCLDDINGLSQLRARPLFPSTDLDPSILPSIDFKIPLDFDISGWGIEIDAHILVARLVDADLGIEDRVNVRMFMDWVSSALNISPADCPNSAPETVIGEHCPLPLVDDFKFEVVEPCQPDESGTEESQSQFRQYRITFCVPMSELSGGTGRPEIAPGDWARLIFGRIAPELVPGEEYTQPVFLNVVSVRYPRKCILLPTVGACGGSECLPLSTS